jgi:hypothetical protein
MELHHLDRRESYVYDPEVKGFDATFFATLTGTPSGAIGSPITLNAAGIASYLMHNFVQQADFNLTIPTAPTGGQATRQWGFKSPSSNNLGGAYFQTTGAVFSAQVYDNAGNNQNVTLTWSAGYTNTATKFSIKWEPDVILFKINDAVVASFATIAGSPGATLPVAALPVYINNAVADALTLNYLQIYRAAEIQ